MEASRFFVCELSQNMLSKEQGVFDKTYTDQAIPLTIFLQVGTAVCNSNTWES